MSDTSREDASVCRSLLGAMKQLEESARKKARSEEEDLLAPYWRTRARLLKELREHAANARENARAARPSQEGEDT